MPKPPLPAELEQFLARPNPAVIATLGRDGAPATVATWYMWDRGRVVVNMDQGRKRLANLVRDPRVSMTVVGDDDWYRHVSLQGRVALLEPDTGLDGIDRLSRHYTGQPFARRDRQRVSAWIEIESWHAWAGAAPWMEPGHDLHPSPAHGHSATAAPRGGRRLQHNECAYERRQPSTAM